MCGIEKSQFSMAHSLYGSFTHITHITHIT